MKLLSRGSGSSGFPGVRPTMSFKFIDESEKLLAKMAKARKKRLMKAGSLTRTIMRRSIRFRKRKKSSPGDPPFAHVPTSRFGLRWIFYAYDPGTKTVVVGPVVGNDKTNAPAALEFGGRAKIKLSGRVRRARGKKWQNARIRKRPYSRPALEAASEKYPAIFEGMV